MIRPICVHLDHAYHDTNTEFNILLSHEMTWMTVMSISSFGLIRMTTLKQLGDDAKTVYPSDKEGGDAR